MPTDPVPNSTVAPTVAATKPETEDEKRLSEAIDKYKRLSEKAGGHENLQKVFDLVGTEGFAPAKPAKGTGEEDLKRAKEFLDKNKPDLTLKDNSGRELGYAERPRGYGAKYLEQDWKINKIDKPDTPAKLKAEEWAELAATNQFFHGWSFGGDHGLRRARFPAFRLKPTSLAGNQQVQGALVPHFEVFDDSWISIKQVESEVEKAMASNGFSSLAIQGSVAGGGWGVSVAASAGVNKETQDSKSSTTSKNSKEYVATYNFPRVRVFLDKYNLEVTDRCAEYIKAIRDALDKVNLKMSDKNSTDSGAAVAEAIRIRDSFLEEYGQIFATTFLLGGQLTGSRSSESFGNAGEAVARDAMKIAASLKVEYKGPVVSAGVSASVDKETSNSTKSKETTSITTSSLTWSARGGNTLLCANPSEWANSVSSYSSWRTLEQDGVLYLPRLISVLTGGQNSAITTIDNRIYSDIEGKLNSIANSAWKAQPAVPAGSFMGFIRLETPAGKFLTWKKDPFNKSFDCLQLTTNPAEAAVFQVLDADTARQSESSPTLAQLIADKPLYLTTTSAYSRLADSGNQIPGVCTNEDGLITPATGRQICRWSFKSKNSGSQLNFVNLWNGQGSTTIYDGDDVILYCHSFRFGSYRSKMENTPYFAPNVITRFDYTDVLCVGELSADFSLKGLDRLSTYADIDIDARKHLKQELRDLIEDRVKLRDLMQRFDRRQEQRGDITNLEDLRVFFGVSDPANRSRWNALWTISTIKSVNGSGSATIKLNDENRLSVLATIHAAVENNLKTWAHVDNQANPPFSFKVKFVAGFK